MIVRYSEEAQQSGDFQRLERATKYLEMNSGPSAAKVEAEWDRIRGAGDQPIYTLRLIDWSGTAMAGFGPDELNDTHDLRYRLLRLWGDVLQVRSHKHLQKLLETSGSEA